jgi:hypothetical protein
MRKKGIKSWFLLEFPFQLFRFLRVSGGPLKIRPNRGDDAVKIRPILCQYT